MSDEHSAELHTKIREFTHELLADGYEAPEISFLLSLTATEMGLQLTDNSIQVFIPVLNGLLCATQMMSQTDETDNEAEETEEQTDQEQAETCPKDKNSRPHLTIVH